MILRKVIITALVCLSVLSILPALAGGDKARIVTSVNKPLDCMFSVDVYEINGKLVTETPLAFDIDPGKYTIKARSVVDTRLCMPALTSITRDLPIDPLEIEVEAGKSYFIGFNAKANNRREWKLEVWKVE